MDVQVVYSPAPGPASGLEILRAPTLEAFAAGTSFAATAPTTLAGEQIIAILAARTPGTVTPPANFSFVGHSVTNGNCAKIYVYEWDGTGTRPNNNTQTFTTTSSDTAHITILAMTAGGGAANWTTSSGSSSVDVNLPTFSASANSSIFYIVGSGSDDVIQPLGPTGHPTAVPGAYPATQGYWQVADALDSELSFWIMQHGASAGTIGTGIADFNSFSNYNTAVFEVLA